MYLYSINIRIGEKYNIYTFLNTMSWPFHDDACCPIAKSSSELSITSRWVLAFGSIIFSTPALIHAPRHSRQPLRDIHSASGDSGERRLSMGKCQGQAGVLV